MDSWHKGLCVGVAAALAWSAQAAPPKKAEPPKEIYSFKRDAAPAPGSARAQALAALAGAQEATLSSLQSWTFPDELKDLSEVPRAQHNQAVAERYQRSRQQWCESAECFYQTRVLGRTPVAAADLDAMRKLLRGALGAVPPYPSTCLPQYRHALSYVSAGKRYDILLSYPCGQILIGIDGQERERGQASLTQQRALDEMLTRAGVPLAAPAKP
ncbi:hypothetical protein J5226_07905 [Lysobacter sp. K5869]|uniref:hypothetical protein n=1 Tax=Lysobacter sp. K5869 TaxID=2820808 RepID=UPI001C061EEC|nr:hypothetical protein [Lysobacter sp. K5869]QWP78304.1 hypothetical protein J5226_07905 [Lysobacter sp. K5869]